MGIFHWVNKGNKKFARRNPERIGGIEKQARILGKTIEKIKVGKFPSLVIDTKEIRRPVWKKNKL